MTAPRSLLIAGMPMGGVLLRMLKREAAGIHRMGDHEVLQGVILGEEIDDSSTEH
jgi:hypothetical protein